MGMSQQTNISLQNYLSLPAFILNNELLRTYINHPQNTHKRIQVFICSIINEAVKSKNWQVCASMLKNDQADDIEPFFFMWFSTHKQKHITAPCLVVQSFLQHPFYFSTLPTHANETSLLCSILKAASREINLNTVSARNVQVYKINLKESQILLVIEEVNSVIWCYKWL